MRRHRSRVPNLVAGAIAAVVILAACWLVFGGPTPFGGGAFRLRAVFTVQTQLHLASPVRIAGVDVGTVTAIKRVGGSSPAAVVTMTINHDGLPVHANATADIRPRLFLEGNFYVDVAPGTPNAPNLASGSTLPATHTTGPVQLDRVLSALNSNARGNLQTLLQGFGSALNGPAKGGTAGESLNQSLKYSANAFKASAIVNQALLGQSPHDLSGAVGGTQRVFGALSASQGHLSDLVTAFNTTMRALADRQDDLQQTLALLPGTLRATDATLGPLQSSFAPTRTFARELLPGVKQLGPTIDAALPWLTQSTALVSDQDLGGLLKSLTPAIQGTASTVTVTRSLLQGSDTLARCLNHTVIPTGNETISDPPVTTGLKVYQELFQSAVGIASASQNFDGNGRYVRSSTGGGSDRVATGSLPGGGPLYGNAVLPPLGTRPAYPGKAPPLNRSVPCLKQSPPNLNSAKTAPGP